MTRFNENATCPKCGGQSIGAMFCKYPGVLGCYGGCGDIHRRCRRCHYEWKEKPLDAPEEVAP